MTDPLRFRIPASTANLGPGFGVLGLALDRVFEISVEVKEAGGLVVERPDAESISSLDLRHDSVLRSLRATAERFDIKSKLARQDLNLECLDQNQVCYLLHHGPVMRQRGGPLATLCPNNRTHLAARCSAGPKPDPRHDFLRRQRSSAAIERPMRRQLRLIPSQPRSSPAAPSEEDAGLYGPTIDRQQGPPNRSRLC